MGTSFNLVGNTPIILRLTLSENDSSKFVKAIVRDQNGVQLAGSPFTLNNLGDGRYYFKDEINLKFPVNATEVSALYQIYDDNAFTIPTVDYQFQVEDVFRLDESDGNDNILTAIEDLTNMVNKVLTLGTDIEAEIENDDEPLEAEIEDNDEPIEAEIEE